MAIYMLVPTEDAERLERVVLKAFPSSQDHFVLPNKGACFVNFSGTSMELSKLLDLTGTEKKEDRPCPAIITLVTTFGGFGPSDLWEWLQTRTGK